MDLESVFQSEVSQKEKNKYCILSHIYEIQENGTDDPICRRALETQTWRTDLWAWCGKERLGEIERIARKRTLSHVRWIADRKSVV